MRILRLFLRRSLQRQHLQIVGRHGEGSAGAALRFALDTGKGAVEQAHSEWAHTQAHPTDRCAVSREPLSSSWTFKTVLSVTMLGEAQESLASLLGNNREPSLREQIEEMSAGGGGCCCSLTFEVRQGLLCRVWHACAGARTPEPRLARTYTSARKPSPKP